MQKIVLLLFSMLFTQNVYATIINETQRDTINTPAGKRRTMAHLSVDTLKTSSGAIIVLLGNFMDAAGRQQNFSHVQVDSFSSDSVTVTGNGVVTGNFAIQGGTTIGNASGDALTYHPSAWTLTNAVTITGTWTNLGTVTTVDINGGTVDGVVIGGASAAAGTFTTISGTKVTGTDSLISGLVTNWPTYRYVVAPSGLKRGSYSSIQAALNAAPIGATVFVTAGQYTEAVTISKRGQRLVGESPDSTIINGGLTGTALTITSARVTVENIRLQTDAGGGNNYHGLSGNVDSLTLRNVQIAGADGQGINAAGNGWLLENVFIDNADGYSIAASGLSNSVITNSRIQNSVDAGIYLGGSHRNTITNNYIISGGTHGIQDNANKKTIIMGNHISGSGTTAIRIEAASDSLIVIGNVCETNGIAGSGTNPKPATLTDLNIVP